MGNLNQTSNKARQVKSGDSLDLTWSPVATNDLSANISVASALTALVVLHQSSASSRAHTISMQASTGGWYDPLTATVTLLEAGSIGGMSRAGCERGFASHAFNPNAFTWTSNPFTLDAAFDERAFNGDAFQAYVTRVMQFLNTDSVFTPVQGQAKLNASFDLLDTFVIDLHQSYNTLQTVQELLVDDAIAYSTINAYNKTQFADCMIINDDAVHDPLNIVLPDRFMVAGEALQTGSTFDALAFNLKQIFDGASSSDFSDLFASHAFNLKQVAQPSLLECSRTIVPSQIWATVDAVTNVMHGPADMTQLVFVSADDAYNIIEVPWDVIYMNAAYASIGIGSNSYITFGGGSTSYSNLHAGRPALPKIMICAADRSWQRLFYKITGAVGSRTLVIRYEGSTGTTGTVGSPEITWEASFKESDPSVVELNMGVNAAAGSGLSGVFSDTTKYADLACASNSGVQIITGVGVQDDVEPPHAFNLTQHALFDAPVTHDIFDSTAFNRITYTQWILTDTEWVGDAIAFNHTTLTDALVIDAGSTELPVIENTVTIVDPVHVYDSSILSGDMFNSMQDYLLQFIDMGEAQAPDVYNMLQQSQFELVDTFAAHAPDAQNALQEFMSTHADDHEIYLSDVWLQDQHTSGLLVDAGGTHAPHAYNVKQIIDALMADVSTAYNHEVVNVDQWFSFDATWADAIFSHTVTNFTQHVTVDHVDAGACIQPDVQNRNRTFVFDVSDTFNAHAPQVSNKNARADVIMVDAISIHAPDARKTLMDVVDPLHVDAGTIHAPVQTNWDSIAAFTMHDAAQVFECVAGNWIQAAQIDAIWLDEIHAHVVENRNKTYALPLVDDLIVDPIDSVLNVNREFLIGLVEEYGIFTHTSSLINQHISPELLHDSDVFASYAGNFRTISDVLVLDDGTVNLHDVLTKPSADVACVFGIDNELVSFNLATSANHKFVAFAHEGIAAQCSMFMPEATSLTCAAHSGESLSCELGFAFVTFKDMLALSGEGMTLDELATEHLMFMHAGEYTQASMATEMLIEVSLQADNRVEAEIDTHESWPLGIIDFYEGTSSVAFVSYKLSGEELKPHVIGVDARADMSFDMPWVLDMAIDGCCSPPYKPVKHMNINVNMDSYNDLFDVYYGEKLITSASLSNNIVMSAVMSEGVWAYFKDTPVLQISDDAARSGESMTCVMDLDDTTHLTNLCKGNFLLLGSDASVEMISLLSDECEEFTMRSGEFMKVGTLAQEYHLPAFSGIGDAMMVDLHLMQWAALFEIEPICRAALSTGSQLVPVVLHVDAEMLCDMEIPALMMMSGESMSAELVVHRTVEFLEAGGVLNEYVNTGGRSFLVAIEGYYFHHDLRTRSG